MSQADNGIQFGSRFRVLGGSREPWDTSDVRRAAGVVFVIASAAVLAPPATASDATLKKTFLRGVAQVNGPAGATAKYDRLLLTRERLIVDKPSSVQGRVGKRLAVEGFGLMLKGLALAEDAEAASDEGDVDRAVALVTKISGYQSKGAARLRSAGRMFGVRVTINGFPGG